MLLLLWSFYRNVQCISIQVLFVFVSYIYFILFNYIIKKCNFTLFILCPLEWGAQSIAPVCPSVCPSIHSYIFPKACVFKSSLTVDLAHSWMTFMCRWLLIKDFLPWPVFGELCPFVCFFQEICSFQNCVYRTPL